MNSKSFLYPQKMGRIILSGMEEIMGAGGVDAVLQVSPIEGFSQANMDHSISFESVSLLQESLYWLSRGKVFNVEETTCVAKGDESCTIVIDKIPLS